VYEIIRLHWTKKVCPLTNSPSNKEYKAYRIDVKKRLNAPFRVIFLNIISLKKIVSFSSFLELIKLRLLILLSNRIRGTW
jgi:hypothetical protein